RSAASLLTGGFPKQTGIPADEYKIPSGPQAGRYRLGADGSDDALPLSFKLMDPKVSTLFKLVNDTGLRSAAYVGDPAMSQAFLTKSADTGDTPGLFWSPQNTQDQDPRLCPTPRTPPAPPAGAPAGTPAPPVACDANDNTTLTNGALNDLKG